jgi:phosphoribosylaminoimidazolecarboxamide formyltransferase/IMP cyclohydrolase
MPTALFSVSDKTGLVEFAAGLHARGWRLVASGGTASALRAADLPARPVASVTGEPEILSGRVKTLHPAIHAAILARGTPEDMETLRSKGWEPIDLVAVNLYPFEQVVARGQATIEEAVENIDIGGVALLRAAAKNFNRVTVLCDPGDYQPALSAYDDMAFRRRMAFNAFRRCREYDAAIEAFFAPLSGAPELMSFSGYAAYHLRYGENPHQSAALFVPESDGTPLGAHIHQGKPLSYNNILDLDAAWRAAASFPDPAVVVVKHNSPCGVACSPSASAAVRPAIASDPVSAFGSVIACNREIDEGWVGALDDLFVECLIAPGFTQGALEALATSPKLRVLEMSHSQYPETHEFRSVMGGVLRQAIDLGDPEDAPPWRTVTTRAPSEREMAAMRFAWRACQHVKSNAVLLAQSRGEERFTVGIGGGQPNRVDCVRIAGERAGGRARGSVLASDAFFPFPDGVEAAAALGVRAIVQPGGSVRDAQVIAAADRQGLCMVFTGVRHFRH